jgi:hypothetical protein
MITDAELEQLLEAEAERVQSYAIGGQPVDSSLAIVLSLYAINRNLARIARAVEKSAASPSLDAGPAARASTPGTITPGRVAPE